MTLHYDFLRTLERVGPDNLISIPGNYWQFSQTLY